MARVLDIKVLLKALTHDPESYPEITAERILRELARDQFQRCAFGPVLMIVSDDPRDPFGGSVRVKIYYDWQPGEKYTAKSVLAGTLRRYARRVLNRESI